MVECRQFTSANRAATPPPSSSLSGPATTCVSACARVVSACARQVRLWDYSKWRGGGEVVLDCGETGDGAASALALHPTGSQLAAGFDSRLRIFTVLHNELRPFRDLTVSKVSAPPPRACRRAAPLVRLGLPFCI